MLFDSEEEEIFSMQLCNIVNKAECFLLLIFLLILFSGSLGNFFPMKCEDVTVKNNFCASKTLGKGQNPRNSYTAHYDSLSKSHRQRSGSTALPAEVVYKSLLMLLHNFKERKTKEVIQAKLVNT